LHILLRQEPVLHSFITLHLYHVQLQLLRGRQISLISLLLQARMATYFGNSNGVSSFLSSLSNVSTSASCQKARVSYFLDHRIDGDITAVPQQGEKLDR
jgi:hypothetical protein